MTLQQIKRRRMLTRMVRGYPGSKIQVITERNKHARIDAEGFASMIEAKFDPIKFSGVRAIRLILAGE